MLNRQEIIEFKKKSELHFSGKLRGNSLQLSLGSTILPLNKESRLIKPWLEESLKLIYDAPYHDWKTYDLKPNTLILCSTEEKIKLGHQIMGIIGTMSHIARFGVFIHLSSPYVDPGFEGHLTLEIFNSSPNRLRLLSGMPVGKLYFSKLKYAENTLVPRYYGSSTELQSLYHKEFGGINDKGNKK